MRCLLLVSRPQSDNRLLPSALTSNVQRRGPAHEPQSLRRRIKTRRPPEGPDGVRCPGPAVLAARGADAGKVLRVYRGRRAEHGTQHARWGDAHGPGKHGLADDHVGADGRATQ